MSNRTNMRRGFTILEMLAVVAIIGTLVGLLLPGIQSLRERARQISCSNNLMQVGLGVSAYHASFDQLPVQLSGTDGSTVVGADNDRRLSFLVGLLPFLGHESTIEELRGPLPVEEIYGDMMSSSGQWSGQDEWGQDESVGQDADQKFWVAGGPEPFQKNYQVWLFEIPEFRCPSDPGIGDPALGRTNYAACLGDGIVAMDTGPMKEVLGAFEWDEQRAAQTEAAMRGAFVPRTITRYDDITDGLSYTLLLGEVATGLGDRDRRTDPLISPGEKVLRDRPNWAYQPGIIDGERPMFWSTRTKTITDNDRSVSRGYRWADGAPVFTAFNTILPPNSAIALSGKQEDGSGILPPSSRHQGGIGVCMADGSVRFISDSIDAGERNSPTPYIGSKNTPGEKTVYGIWGGMGTRASEELVFVDGQ